LLFLCSTATLAQTPPAPEANPGFEEIEPVAYDAMFVDAVQAHHAGHKGQAFAKFMRLACGGDKAAQEQIGQMYLVGEGAYQNTAMAYLWLKTAAEFNFGDYRTLAKKVEKVMKPEQAKRFNQLADDMIAQYGERATNVTCSTHSGSSFSSNIKGTVVCSPKRSGGMLLVQRCYSSELDVVKSVLHYSP
jgi:hypothetical protein